MADHAPKRPKDRQGFKIGIICALTLEAEMVELIFDERWKQNQDGRKYGKAINDPNTYTTGIIADHNVVLAYCPGIGSNSAAQVATWLTASFTGIKLVFVVGICGAVPFYSLRNRQQEVVLGDCLISTAIIQFDLVREGPNGSVKKDGLDGLGRAAVQIRSLMAKLQTFTNRQELMDRLFTHLQALQKINPEATEYPGKDKDRLYESSYLHTHQESGEACEKCNFKLGICEKTCKDLGCDENQLVHRKRLENDTIPSMHFGHLGSSNTVLKSGLKRDELAEEDRIIGFEMEGSGIWDICPTIVIKSACDYADSHKNKDWQEYAAGVAAAGLKAFLAEVEFSDETGLFTASANDSGDTRLVQPNNITNDVPINAVAERHSTAQQIIQDADSAIRKYYNSSERLKIERLSGQTLSLEQCYINLALTEISDERQMKEDKISFDIKARLRLESSTIGQTINLSELFDSRKLANGHVVEPRRIFIRGRAGIGKTTLCKKIVFEFLQHRLANKLFDRLFWLPLRRVRSMETNYTWREILRGAYPSPPTVDGGSWDDLMEVMSKQLASPHFQSKTLFLLDGLDEVSQDWGAEDDAFQFVQSLICDMPNIIITSRPQASSMKTGRFDIQLETTGFTLEQIDSYMQNCTQDRQSLSRMSDLISTRPLLQSLLRIPVQLDAFCCTWVSEDEIGGGNPLTNDVSTMTDLYVAISTELCKKDLGRLRRNKQPHSLPSRAVQDLLAEELRFLELLAFQGLINNVIDFTPRQQETIDATFRQSETTLPISYGTVLEQLSFLRTSDVYQHKSKRQYHFLHLTYQEFFAAKHFVRHWRSNANLTLLDLTSRTDEDEGSTLPFEFLQTRKYDPRFNIFWRFVTGLMQKKTEKRKGNDKNSSLVKRKDILTLFEALNSEPKDLLGAVHRRLLMYCLNEVVQGNDRQVQQLCQEEQNKLYQWVTTKVEEIDNDNVEIPLFREMEFPESVLCDLLQTKYEHTHNRILSRLAHRPLLSTRVLRSISAYIDDRFSVKVQLDAVQLVFQNSRNSPEDILARAEELHLRLAQSKDVKTRCSAAELLGLMKSIPGGPLTTLIKLLKDENTQVRDDAARILGGQSLPVEVITTLIELLKNENKGIELLAFRVLKEQYLPAEAIRSLVELLKDTANHDLQASAARILGDQSLPAEAITALGELLTDENNIVRRSVADALGKQSLPAKAIPALVELLRDEDSIVRRLVTVALGKQSLPAEFIIALGELLRDEDSTVRCSIAEVLGGHSLPAETINTLIELLNDEASLVRCYAARALLKQSRSAEAISTLIELLLTNEGLTRDLAITSLKMQSSLPPEAVSRLIELLNDENSYVRCCAVAALEKQSLPAEAVRRLTELLSEESSLVRYRAAEALGNQSSLPAESISPLIELLNDEDSLVRSCAAAALDNQPSLPTDYISRLIEWLNGEDSSLRNYATISLGKLSSLPTEAISPLIELLKDEDRSVQRSATETLGKQSSLPAGAVSRLIELLNDEDSLVQRNAATALEKHGSMLAEAIPAVIRRLTDHRTDIYRLLKSVPLFFSTIKKLDTQSWLHLWSYWKSNAHREDICCYVLNECLWLQSGNDLHQISTSLTSTERLLGLQRRPLEQLT